jgi:hypothetical protein
MTGIDISLSTQVLSVLLAVALYGAAYLSFVRLLRYPRNWQSPSMAAYLATSVLVALTLAQISISADGFDGSALIISSGFVVVLFYIISAPAIAFQPTSRSFEFLARHGDYVGLWLLGPVLFIVLLIPNVKLQAVMATAMVIELAWFLRQRWNVSGRQLYALNDNDLSVLDIQAKGDLPAFRRRHGIRELELSKDAVKWWGCGKNTAPCPFNLYVNRLGLNTAPCCREHMKDLSHYVAASLSEIGAIHWLEGGSLLGAVREKGGLLDWEDDIDISVLLDDDMTWERLATGLSECGARDGYYVDLFEKTGFISISFDPPGRWPLLWERNRLRGEIRTDIAIYRHAISHGQPVLERQSYKGAMPITEGGGYGIPQDIVLPTLTVPFLGGEIACPNQSESYLRLLYGDFRKVEYTYVDAGPAQARAHIGAACDS